MTGDLSSGRSHRPVNAERASGKKLSLAVEFSGLNETYTLAVENSVLNYSKKPSPSKAKLTLAKATFDRMQAGELTAEQAIASSDLRIEGRREAVSEFVALVDTFPAWFDIVTP